MFTANPANSSESLEALTGGGFGGYWPAKIWNTFALAEFANLPQQTFQNAVFSGTNWNQVGKLAQAHGHLLGERQEGQGAGQDLPDPGPDTKLRLRPADRAE